MKTIVVATILALCGTTAARAADCSNVFKFQTRPTLSLHDVSYMGTPETYEKGDAVFEVRQFDYDDLPVRDHMLAVGLVSGGPHGNKINPVGGFVLSKFEAYFDKPASEALNRKNGNLNAVFVTPGSKAECGQIRYVVTYTKDMRLLVNGKLVEKFAY